ncbi:UNVERIFIED_CONTAM: MAP3K epsilon protein kinase [Sesamum calycinum]|uniref:MAP3K epsilon protein kinase n=1 Tax=Sesamum calycinum TaxID=2727403 RepID=A0AAW2PPT2_9LAMI
MTMIPVVMSFAVPDRPPEVRFEAAFFLQQLCQSSSSTLQMFIACRGIPILVGFLETDYAKYREMVHMAIDGMWQVFKLKKSTSRNDFCRIAAKNGILLRLVNTLYNLDEATRLASGATGGGFSLDRLDLRPRSTSLDSSNPSLVQIDSSVYGIDRPDHFKAKQGGQTSQVGLQEPSRASVSHSSDSSSFPPDADRVSTDRWRNEPCKAEVDVKQQRGSNVVGRPSIDKARKSIDVLSNGSSTPTTSQQDIFRPQLSLLDKEPPRRHSGQLEYVRNLSGVERHEKTNGLDLLMAEFADVSGRDRENSNVESLPKNLPRVSSKKLGRLPSNGAIAGTSRLVMRTTSGMLSSPDVLNCKPESETSSSLLSHAVSPWNVDIAREYLEKVADLLLEFAAADTTVKSYMCSQSLLSRLLQMFDNIESQILLKLLKCINHLSTDPHYLENLQRADAIKYLIPNLDLNEGSLVPEIHHEVLNALFNLCKINKKRQELAAENGIIPHLMHFIITDSPLKQYALPLLCDMAQASRNSREQLRVHGGLDVYLSLLEDEVWSVTALDSLAVCLAHDNENRKVEQALLKKEAVQKLVKFFQCCTEQQFLHILEPFLKIITYSISVFEDLSIHACYLINLDFIPCFY